MSHLSAEYIFHSRLSPFLNQPWINCFQSIISASELQTMRRTRRSRLLNLGIIFIAYSAVYVYSAAVKELGNKDEFVPANDDTDNTTPNPLYTTTAERTTEYDDGSASTSTTTILPLTEGAAKDAAPTRKTYRQKRNCTPPAIDQFPPPIMGPKIRERGGLIIHILIAIFTFLGLAIVCDDYFVSSLDRICEGEWIYMGHCMGIGLRVTPYIYLSSKRKQKYCTESALILNEMKSDLRRRRNTFSYTHHTLTRPHWIFYIYIYIIHTYLFPISDYVSSYHK